MQGIHLNELSGGLRLGQMLGFGVLAFWLRLGAGAWAEGGAGSSLDTNRCAIHSGRTELFAQWLRSGFVRTGRLSSLVVRLPLSLALSRPTGTPSDRRGEGTKQRSGLMERD